MSCTALNGLTRPDTVLSVVAHSLVPHNNLVVHVLCLEGRVSWVRVPPEAAHFSHRKSYCFGCALLLCLGFFDITCFFLPSHLLLKHVYTRFGVWCHWWFHYNGLLLHTELLVSLFIRCTMTPSQLSCLGSSVVERSV